MGHEDQMLPIKHLMGINRSLHIRSQFQVNQITTVVTRLAYHHQLIHHDHHQSDITIPKQAMNRHHYSFREILMHFPRTQPQYGLDSLGTVVVVQDPVQLQDRTPGQAKAKHKVKHLHPQGRLQSHSMNSTHCDKQ